MAKVTVNSGKEMVIDFNADGVLLNDQPVNWDQIKIDNNRFHVLKNGKSFVCEILSTGASNKSFEIKVNGNSYQVNVADKFDELLHSLGMDKPAVHKINSIKAPMPGLVLKLMVTLQQELKEGDAVLILEAMKMENVIKSPGNGIVKSIKIKERDSVEKNQVLIELE